MKGSKIFGGAIAALGSALAFPFGTKEGTKIRAYAAERLVPHYALATPAGPIRFACPTRAAARMPMSFFHLEPETARWIDALVGPDDVMWDVGANIGTFALYAAHVRRAHVVAFEPSAQTFGVLYSNIALNRLGERVQAFCLALANETTRGEFFLHATEAGEALNAYGAPVNLRGVFAPAFRQATLSFRIDDFITMFGAPAPQHIKIDVDGNELEVLQGARKSLETVRSVLVELDAAFSDKSKDEAAIRLLMEAGLREDRAFSSGWNRVFVRG
ncbi:MAG: FkbM family methyltransferase [Alphaproteobacteria bacterium]|nr:FkbM family methyltransferase [Alphaproteobacteria bacterium]